MSVLKRVNSSADVSALSHEELHELASELRSEIIRVCALGGGHLASSLGAVELTVALHKLYTTSRDGQPHDRIVWDVGHQTYGHKIITGRKDRIETIRKADGLAGFTTSSESPDDALTVGHASTSLAAAFGMALARDARKSGDDSGYNNDLDYNIVAVIGDGALTGGMALAALNQIGHVKPNMTIILNDNEMSISENVGAINHYLNTLQVQPWYRSAEAKSKAMLKRVWQPLVELSSRAKKATRRFLDPHSANPFYAMGVRYVGPIDGHDIDQLLYYLEHVRRLEGPTMLHVITKKGKGYKIAESDPIYWHGPPKFDAHKPVKTGKGFTWSNLFGQSISTLAEGDNRIWVITPAMREGSGLVEYSKQHPERYLDVGIAEDVAVTTAAGLALQGEKPVVAIYSTFLQRGFDQVVHDVCLENLDVLFAIDRAGLVGGDGATHQGIYDIAYLRSLPNMSIAMPKDGCELKAMLKAALALKGPKAIRWPRGNIDPVDITPIETWDTIEWGKWELLQAAEEDNKNKAITILALGPTVTYALESLADAKDVNIVNARFVLPLDDDMLRLLASQSCHIITVEDHVRTGGLGSAVVERLQECGISVPVTRLGLPGEVIMHGNPKAQHAEFGIDAEGIKKAVEQSRVNQLASSNS